MGFPRRLRRVLHIILLLCSQGLVPVIAAEQQRPKPLMVAVAANFAGPGQRLADIFTEGSGVPVELIVGATGLLHAQIVQGAPFDLLLAADTQRPLALKGLSIFVIFGAIYFIFLKKRGSSSGDAGQAT